MRLADNIICIGHISVMSVQRVDTLTAILSLRYCYYETSAHVITTLQMSDSFDEPVQINLHNVVFNNIICRWNGRDFLPIAAIELQTVIITA